MTGADAAPGTDDGRGDRPSRHGRILGESLAAIAEAGRAAGGGDLAMCATCAFREGSVPNQTAGTGMVALETLLGVDQAMFGCHHGMVDGQPSKPCAGSILARRAPWATVRAEVERMRSRIEAMEGPDAVREAYDAWLGRVDPEGRLDCYELARAYARMGDRGPLSRAP